MGAKIVHVAPDVVKKLTDRHINRYRNRIAFATDTKRPGGAVKNGIRVEECRRYLDLWTSIASKGHEWEKLTPREQQEIREAIVSGELED